MQRVAAHCCITTQKDDITTPKLYNYAITYNHEEKPFNHAKEPYNNGKFI